MTTDVKLKLGTRASPLAMVQAEQVRDRLCAAHGWTREQVELVPVTASGDKVLDRPLAEIGGKALWTKELDAWLAEGAIDASVHSLKDVETLRPDIFTLGAILERADKRDRLIGAASIAALPPGATVGTSAPRRASQLLNQRPDCKLVMFRGNVATRLSKLAAGEADATFLAAAGLERLGEDGVGHALDVDSWLPAPSQGAIAVECRSDDERVQDYLSALDHMPSRAEVQAERALLLALGGTCHSSIAVNCDYVGGELVMRAVLFSADGAERIEARARFAADDHAAPVLLAQDLLARSSPAVRSLFMGQP